MCPFLKLSIRFQVTLVVVALIAAILLAQSRLDLCETTVSNVGQWLDRCSLKVREAKIQHDGDSYVRGRRALALLGTQLDRLEKHRADTAKELSRHQEALENARRALRARSQKTKGEVIPTRSLTALERDIVRLAQSCDHLSADLSQLDASISALAGKAAEAAGEFDTSLFDLFRQNRSLAARTFEHDANQALRDVRKSLNDLLVVGPGD